MTNQPRALVFTPTPSHPPFRGNRQRIIQMANLFRSAGFHLTLAIGAKLEKNAGARDFWDTIAPIRPTPPWKPSNSIASMDSWYREGLGAALSRAVEESSAEVVIFNYVFHSKALEFLPSGVKTILDTHEVFSAPPAQANRLSFRRGFFACSADEERRYLDRADIAVAISDADAQRFRILGTKSDISHIPYVLSDQTQIENLHMSGIPVWGMVMSANDHNLASLRDFIHHVSTRFGSTPPFRILIAGDIYKLAYRYFPHRAPFYRKPWISYLGQVPDLGELYRQVRGVVVPVVGGTGMAIKFAHPLAFGIPIVSTAIGSRGTESGHALHNLSGNAELVDRLPDISAGQLRELSQQSQVLQITLRKTVERGFNALKLL